MSKDSASLFLQARDVLQRHRDDYDAACREFRWPVLDEFNWALDHFDAQRLLAALERYRVTSLCAPPTVWRMLIQQDLAAWRGRLALREVIGAGEPINPGIIEAAARWAGCGQQHENPVSPAGFRLPG